MRSELCPPLCCLCQLMGSYKRIQGTKKLPCPESKLQEGSTGRRWLGSFKRSSLALGG